MKIISEEHFKRMEMMSRYFKEKSIINSAYLPEYKISEEINKMICKIEKPILSDFEKIVELMKNIENTDHYGGSHWHDYQIHLNAILKENGFEPNMFR